MKIFFISFLSFTSISFAESNQTENIRLKVKENLKDIHACYEAISGESKLGGKVVVNWEVDDSGSVTKISINDMKSSLKDSKLNQCIIDQIKNWKFPPAKKSQTITVQFPFVFEKLTFSGEE